MMLVVAWRRASGDASSVMATLSVALVNRAYGPAWKSFRALAVGFPMATLAAFLFTLAARGLGRIPAP
jgi:hypothetical protein